MKVTYSHLFYDHTVTMDQIGAGSLIEAIDYVRNLCGGFVWSECQTTEQELPTHSKYIDTFYNINVYYDWVTESFLFEEFN